MVQPKLQLATSTLTTFRCASRGMSLTQVRFSDLLLSVLTWHEMSCPRRIQTFIKKTTMFTWMNTSLELSYMSIGFGLKYDMNAFLCSHNCRKLPHFLSVLLVIHLIITCPWKVSWALVSKHELEWKWSLKKWAYCIFKMWDIWCTILPTLFLVSPPM